MVSNEGDCRPILMKQLYQKGYGARAPMSKFPVKTWQKIMLNFFKETGNCVLSWQGQSRHPTESCQTGASEQISTHKALMISSYVNQQNVSVYAL